MACKYCLALPKDVPAKVTLHIDNGQCNSCDLYFSAKIKATYIGKRTENGLVVHIARYDKPVICPHCNCLKLGWTGICEDDNEGGIIELPLILELPLDKFAKL